MFPFGLPSSADVCSKTFRNWIFHHYTRRAAQDARFIAAVSDLLRRRASARLTALRWRGDPESVGKVEEFLNDDKIFAKVEAAEAHPGGKDEADIMRTVSSLCSVVSARVPYSPMERQVIAARELGAYTRFFGPPNVFCTVTPDEMGTTLIARIAVAP